MSTALAQDLFPETRAAVEEWKARPEVVGVLHVGSKSRGHGDERSDDDLEVIVTEAHYAGLAPAQCHAMRLDESGGERRLIWDAQILPLSDLARKAGSTFDLDRWPYERAPVVFDRAGMVAPTVAAIAAMAPEFRAARIRHGSVDAWINANRAIKARARGREAAVRMLLARAGTALTRVLFALEWRWAPLDHWLEDELRTLAHANGAADLLVTGLRESDPAAFVRAVESLESRLRAEGVPTDRPGRSALFLEIIHPSRAAERAIHGLI